jgi:hypothetical protein
MFINNNIATMHPLPLLSAPLCSVAAKDAAEREAARLQADNLALEASLRKMMEKEVRL